MTKELSPKQARSRCSLFAVRLVEPLQERSVNLIPVNRASLRIATADGSQKTSPSRISICTREPSSPPHKKVAMFVLMDCSRLRSASAKLCEQPGANFRNVSQTLGME